MEDREMFQATCAECGKSCEVPFRPNGNKPVLCRDCFRATQPDRGGRDGGRSFSARGGSASGGGRHDRGDRQMYSATCEKCGNTCEVPFRPSGDKPVYCNDCFAGVKGSNMGGKSSEHIDQQFQQLNDKLDRILKRLTPSHMRGEHNPAEEAPVSSVDDIVL